MKLRTPVAHIFFWIFGVATCAYYTAVTLSLCSQSPYLLAAFTPLIFISLSNALSLIASYNRRRVTPATLSTLGTLNTLAIITSVLLAVVLSPLCLLAAIGMCICVLYPPVSLMCAFYLCVAIVPAIASISLGATLRNMTTTGMRKPGLPLGSCIAAILACIMVGLFPITVTQACEAAVLKPDLLPQGLLLLRGIGDENMMLQSCYGERAKLPWFFQSMPLFSPINLPSEQKISETDAREIFYRTTGKPFNTVPRTRFHVLGASGPFFDSYDSDWDEDYYSFLEYGDHDFAGETVGGVVKGLSLGKSLISGWIDADEAIAHINWKMNFHVENGTGKEIRAQILLPPNAVATGCLLWINGVKHDCVIGTRDSSRKAYTTSATRGDKPLLVSTAGAGRVLVQSSTGFWGKEAELELQFTAPLSMVQSDQVALPLPIFTERNFAVTEKHAVGLASNAVVTSSLNSLTYNPNQHILTGEIDNADLADGRGTLLLTRNPAVSQVTANDVSPAHLNVIETFHASKLSPTTPTTIVVDGSAPMSASMSPVCDALARAGLKDASIIWASDVPLNVVSHVAAGSVAWNQAIAKLRDSSCLGGQNNTEALVSAVNQMYALPTSTARNTTVSNGNKSKPNTTPANSSTSTGAVAKATNAKSNLISAHTDMTGDKTNTVGTQTNTAGTQINTAGAANDGSNVNTDSSAANIATDQGNIVWIHAGQPVKFRGDRLLNLLRKGPRKISLYEYQVVPGPNEVVKSLDQTGAMIQVPRIASIQNDLERLLNKLSGRNLSYVVDHALAPGSSSPQAGTGSVPSRHPLELAQLCVNQVTLANLDNLAERTKYGTMAEQTHIITPLTSAIVLEDAGEYTKLGVTQHSKPSSAQSKSGGGPLDGLSQFSSAGGMIPVKPEPPMSLIMACAGLIMAMGIWIVRRRRNA